MNYRHSCNTSQLFNPSNPQIGSLSVQHLSKKLMEQITLQMKMRVYSLLLLLTKTAKRKLEEPSALITLTGGQLIHFAITLDTSREIGTAKI